MLQFRQRFSPNCANYCNYGFRTAPCRAVAKFHGLLRNRRNRKSPIGNRRFYREDVGGPLYLAGATVLTIRRLIMALTVAVVTAHAGQALAQGAFPAPLSFSRAAMISS